MKRNRVEIYSLDFMLFAYERRLEEEEMVDEGYMEEYERLSVAEMRRSYAESLKKEACY